MRIVNTITELKSITASENKSGSIGFVPTMGALHQGHLSLVERCVRENSFTIVSIFVNPTQFNNKDDLKRYPKDLASDCKMLGATGCNVVFAPTTKEMYPIPDNRVFNFGLLGNVMEGKHRPGHFNGVAQIVTKLFDIVEPDNAYFGLKDFQQLAVIRKIVNEYNYQVKIIPCPIVREPDGLAMSSRNMLLDGTTRKNAPKIFEVLNTVKKMYPAGDLESIYSYVKKEFEKHKLLELEYFEIVTDSSLQTISALPSTEPCTACIAVYAGKVRLIDNVQLNS